MQEYIIELRNGRQSTYHIKEKLKKNGFYYKDKRWYKKTTSCLEIFRWKSLQGIKCLVYIEGIHERGENYRADYFAAHKPVRRDKYHCAYCGRLLPKEALEVDHIIPIQKAKASVFWQLILSALCPEGVNDRNNLTTACRHCNGKKGANAGLWVLRGYIGKYYVCWVVFRLLLLILFIVWMLCIIPNL